MLTNIKPILFLEEKKECIEENYKDGMYPLFGINFYKMFYEL